MMKRSHKRPLVESSKLLDRRLQSCTIHNSLQHTQRGVNTPGTQLRGSIGESSYCDTRHAIQIEVLPYLTLLPPKFVFYPSKHLTNTMLAAII